MLKWDTTTEEMELIGEIAGRAASLYQDSKVKIDTTDIVMDLTAVHANGCPLDFKKFLSFPDFDFMHDVAGINRHLNRHTGKLGNCFLPRSAR